MLFTTAPFVLLFLPLALAGFFVLGRVSHTGAAAWLFLASLFFYGYWMPEYTLLLLGSIAMNFAIGRCIAAAVHGSGSRQHIARAWLVLGLAGNLGLLGYFKYANFFIANLNLAFGTHWDIGKVVLPIGISFYTFTQIAYLVDTYQKHVNEYKPVHYGLFVTYFPHLIAGPVLHHAQMMPQFGNPAIYRFQAGNFVGGLAIFALGLLKKVVLADGISPYADAVFRPVDHGALPGLDEAWLGALAYTFQLYFDFSGYSDMAVGLSWMFNVRLPFNFDSPYRATSIADFWRRWHISLSTFLRDYLYIALGGNRHGSVRRYLNLAVTMLLGGLWHGASWSFVIWGGLHGAYLMINHGFRAWCGPELLARIEPRRTMKAFGWLLTMLAVVVAWVFFRAETLTGALRMLQGMAGTRPDADDLRPLLWNAGLRPSAGLLWCAVLGAIAFFAPNSNRIGMRVLEMVRHRAVARRLIGGAALTAVLLLVLINAARDSVSAFIYFNF
jgi:alginate O-acetyltransferase complex protein AlgI